MRLPDVIIGGAPKCGTSSLFRWLSTHPEVSGSRVKETRFLLDRGHPLFNHGCNVHDHGLEAFGEFFDPQESEGRVLVEATTHYLYQTTARAVLSRLSPRPRVIFMLRKPSARIYSSYRYSRNNQAALQTDVTFADFVRLSELPNPESYVRPEWRPHLEIWRNEIRYSRYVEHLSEWRRDLGGEHVHVFLFEDLQREPRAFMRRVAETVGIDVSFYDDFPFERHNISYEVRNHLVHRLARRMAALTPGSHFRDAARRLYLRYATSRPRPAVPPEDKAVLRKLDRSFESFNRRLATEYGMDLSAWK